MRINYVFSLNDLNVVYDHRCGSRIYIYMNTGFGYLIKRMMPLLVGMMAFFCEIIYLASNTRFVSKFSVSGQNKIVDTTYSK